MLNQFISVVIPTFNRAHTLPRCLDSVLTQNYPRERLELLVIDDGSNDNTENLLRIYQHLFSIRVLRQSNKGVSSARNLGIRFARYPWIAFLDSDDYWLPDKLTQQLEKISHDQNLVCHTEEIWIRNGTRVNQCKHHKKYAGYTFSQNLPLCAMSPSSIIIHRQIFDAVGLFDESLPACEDYDLWLRITARYKVSFVEKPCIYKTGGHSDQLSRKFVAMDRFRIQSLLKLLKFTTLNQIQLAEVLTVLEQKSIIYLQGCMKHNQPLNPLIDELKQILTGQKWNDFIKNLSNSNSD